jgi:hypothetical protein
VPFGHPFPIGVRSAEFDRGVRVVRLGHAGEFNVAHDTPASDLRANAALRKGGLLPGAGGNGWRLCACVPSYSLVAALTMLKSGGGGLYRTTFQ